MGEGLYQKLQSILGDLAFIYPELVLVIALLLVVLTDLVYSNNKISASITFFGIAISVIFTVIQFSNQHKIEYAFAELILPDRLAAFWKLLLGSGALLFVLISNYRLKEHKAAEYYAMAIVLLLGANFLVMSTNWLMVFLSIETISIVSYILTAFAFTKQGAEAALKYFLFGAVASAIMLYGMSLLYAQTLTLTFTSTAFVDTLLAASSLPFIVGAVFIMAGLFFKVALVPMHIWAPDVYKSATTPVVAYFSVVPKLAAIALLFKVVLVLNLFGQSAINWITFLAIMAMLTMLVGNFSALAQQNVKRLLAYSSIAQSGFLVAGLASFSDIGLTNVLFYATVYLIMNMAAFAMVAYFEKYHRLTEIKDYSGLIQTHPLKVILFLVVMVSLTGLPPTAGFTAKFLIFSAVWEAYNYTENQWLLYLLVFGLLNTVVALFYYLKIPFYMIFREPLIEPSTSKKLWSGENFLIGMLVLAILLLFFKPDWLIGLINNVSFAF